jgi:hypothetical protein
VLIERIATGAKRTLLGVGIAAVLVLSACAKRVPFTALPIVHSVTASAKVTLTFDRNNSLEVVLKNVPEPSALSSRLTRYVLWTSTADGQHITNIGQLRVDKNKAGIKTLTPLRRFGLVITAEESGEVMTPGPDRVFESKIVDW